MSLEVGQTAPDFESIDQDGNPIRLSDFKGQKGGIVFLPQDNTPGLYLPGLQPERQL